MIRAIAALDNRNGLAKDNTIPWHLRADLRRFRGCTKGGTILMGYNTYRVFDRPLPERRNLVATRQKRSLSPGFEAVYDVTALLQNPPPDLWIIGGAKLFTTTLRLVDELYLTRIEHDFDCDSFFPDYADQFELTSTSAVHEENGLRFHFDVYRRK